jgi:hypothetical protein
MQKDLGRDYLSNPRQYDGWLRANVFIGSISALVILTMAFASLFSQAEPNVELSSVSRTK